MKILELFSLSKGKSLKEFDWGSSFIDLINNHLPINHRIGDISVTGDFLYAQLLQLPSDEMLHLINQTIEISGNSISIVNEGPDAAPPRQRAGEDQYERDRYGRGNKTGQDPRKSRVPTISLICAITLVVVCLGMALTQSILSVKSGRAVGDGRTVTSIASIIGDIAKAFVDSGSSPYSNRQPAYPADDQYYGNQGQQYPQDPGIPNPNYNAPRRPTRQPDVNQGLDNRYGGDQDPGDAQEPVRPQSGAGAAPPYD